VRVELRRLPKHLDEEVARLHLERIGVKLTKLTKKQADCLAANSRGGKAPFYLAFTTQPVLTVWLPE
jgi:adenosylhomocysteinase